jgi:hypothetical protein
MHSAHNVASQFVCDHVMKGLWCLNLSPWYTRRCRRTRWRYSSRRCRRTRWLYGPRRCRRTRWLYGPRRCRRTRWLYGPRWCRRTCWRYGPRRCRRTRWRYGPRRCRCTRWRYGSRRCRCTRRCLRWCWSVSRYLDTWRRARSDLIVRRDAVHHRTDLRIVTAEREAILQIPTSRHRRCVAGTFDRAPRAPSVAVIRATRRNCERGVGGHIGDPTERIPLHRFTRIEQTTLEGAARHEWWHALKGIGQQRRAGRVV